YAGTDTPLVITAGSLAEMKKSFETAHKARFGFIDETKELVIEAVSVEAIGGGAKFTEAPLATAADPRPSPARRTPLYSGRRRHDASDRKSTRLNSSHVAIS